MNRAEHIIDGSPVEHQGERFALEDQFHRIEAEYGGAWGRKKRNPIQVPGQRLGGTGGIASRIRRNRAAWEQVVVKDLGGARMGKQANNGRE